MKVYISGANPENRIAEIVESLGHEVMSSPDPNETKGGELTSHSRILEADLVILDHTVKRGVDDHMFADTKGKPMLSLIPESDRRELAPFFKFLEAKGSCDFEYFSSPQDIELIVTGFIGKVAEDKEKLVSAGKERR